MNYKWLIDGTDDGRVITTDEPPDAVWVFTRFSDARDALADHCNRMAMNYRDARFRARQLRLRDVTAC